MKKSLMVLVMLAIFCFTSVALAASPFSDVPANSWTYSAITKLAQAGIIDGYGDGTFRGEKTMTRYEMAQIVANAMTKEDKATAENKALIDKLAAEFANELKSLDIRMTNVEKNMGPLKITGLFNYRYEWMQHPKETSFTNGTVTPGSDAARDGIADSSNTNRTSLYLFIDNQFDGNTYFHGLLETETVGGRSTDATLNFLEGYAATKVGSAEVAVGRFFPSIGMGFFGSPWMDGARVSFGNEVKVRLFSTKLLTNPITYSDSTYNMADAHFAVNKDLNMSLGYVANKNDDKDTIWAQNNGEYYKDYAVGMEFKGIPNINLKTEYAVNKSDYARGQNDNSNANAYFATLKYKGANPYIRGSFGVRVEYKHADPGFDILSYAAPFEWNAPLNWTQAPQGGYNDNIKGFEYGIEYTLAPRMLIDARYDVLKTVNGHSIPCVDGSSYTSQNFATVQVTYLF